MEYAIAFTYGPRGCDTEWDDNKDSHYDDDGYHFWSCDRMFYGFEPKRMARREYDIVNKDGTIKIAVSLPQIPVFDNLVDAVRALDYFRTQYIIPRGYTWKSEIRFIGPGILNCHD